jgi:hypothetical protein
MEFIHLAITSFKPLGVFGGEVACAFLSKKHVFIVFEGVVYA